MEIVGLEPRRSDLARGIIIARSARPLDASTQQALWQALAVAGVTERTEEEIADHADDPDRQLHAAPWLPPAPDELAAQQSALEEAAAQFDIEAVWFVKVETGCDGLAWRGVESDESDSDSESDGDEGEARDPGHPLALQGQAVAKPEEPGEEVLYAAPDVPAMEPVNGDEADDDEVDEDEELAAAVSIEAVQLESHWRNGPPPLEDEVPFPIERYPDIVDDYDWECFGIALKLAGEPLAGEESVVNALFALWLSVYQDERSDDFEPFQRADIIHDRRHRSALMWVEKFGVPITAADQVHFLLWVVSQLHDIVPITWARFENVDEAVKTYAEVEDGELPFVLAGNPFADLFRRQGEDAALAWAMEQRTWSKRELAGMLIEFALEHDPDDAATAAIAERLLRGAKQLDQTCDADGYLAIVLVRQNRSAEAVALARTATRRDVRLLVIREIAEHESSATATALELLDAETVKDSSPEQIAEVVTSIAQHAPVHLARILEQMPNDVALVPALYNASFSVDRPQALAILRRVLALPNPPKDAGGTRTAMVMAWNNACIHAHALGDYRLAVELADGGQSFAAENPYIYHSAACAYAAAGQIDRAIAQVALAIEHEYDHSEKMETDRDLIALHADPRFSALFVEWRAKRADLN